MSRPRVYRKDQQCPRCGSTLRQAQEAAQVRTVSGQADLPLRSMSLPFHSWGGASPPAGEGQEAGGGYVHRGEQFGGYRAGAGGEVGNGLFLGQKSLVGLGVAASPGGATGGTPTAEGQSGSYPLMRCGAMWGCGEGRSVRRRGSGRQ